MKDFDVSSIKNKKDFEIFFDDFLKDFFLNLSHYENNTLKSFLLGLISFVGDIDGYYINVKQTKFDEKSIDWSTLAEIFLAARVYE